MKSEFIFRATGSSDSVREGVRLFLLSSAYTELAGTGTTLSFGRGSALRRLVSFRIEEWPTVLRVSLLQVSDDEVGVMLDYGIATGWHLVGTVDEAILEAEAALLNDYLATGRRADFGASVASVRRPLLVATLMNMTIAIFVIVWVGLFAGFPAHWVWLVAVAVAFGDGVMIMAFADVILAGSRTLPRLAPRPRPRA